MTLGAEGVMVLTKRGRVRGVLADGVAAFKGVPYAAPPFGVNRFKPPQPHQPWSGELDASTYGPSVPAPPYPPPVDKLLTQPQIPGEECLNLNVWTPDQGAAGLPVMVWIHGGAFTNGSGAIPTYDGGSFARHGVVLVTLNYRLGVEGFLRLEDCSPNLGLLDQIAALKWVQDEIQAFGGNPDRVTVFGESAGGSSIAALMAMPAARGLFGRAICQSGPGAGLATSEEATLVAARLAASLGVRPTREAFGTIPADRLLAAQRQLSAQARASSLDPVGSARRLRAFAPVIDGDLLPGRPVDIIRAGASKDVRLIVGSNTDEHRLWLVPGGLIDSIDEETLQRSARAHGLEPDAIEAYRSGRPGATPGPTPGDVYASLLSDQYFRVPSIRLAEAHLEAGGATWMYEFAWPSPQFGGRLGACHALEIGFVFNNLGKGRAGLHGEDPPRDLAATMHQAWVRFATTGDPGWQPYDLLKRPTMIFWPTCKTIDDPRAPERMAWEGLLNEGP